MATFFEFIKPSLSDLMGRYRAENVPANIENQLGALRNRDTQCEGSGSR
jgi:hypothetical protein